MARSTKNNSQTRRRPPGTTPEAVENNLISLATDLAEKQLKEGTASSQVISHFLKLGSTRNQVEKAKIEQEVELLKAKQKNLESAARVEELYEEAIKAMRSYAGYGGSEDED